MCERITCASPPRPGLLAAPALPLASELLGLLQTRVAHLEAQGLLDMTEIVVVDADTTEAQLMEAIGFTPLIDLDARRFGQPLFCSPVEYVSKVSPGYFEAIVPVGSSGFAFQLLIHAQASRDLVALCQELTCQR